MTMPAPARRTAGSFANTERFHTIADVATRLCISTRSVHRLIERGELETHRFGSAVRISEGALQRCLAAART
jgi:excisionase family DNA binding protein